MERVNALITPCYEYTERVHGRHALFEVIVVIDYLQRDLLTHESEDWRSSAANRNL